MTTMKSAPAGVKAASDRVFNFSAGPGVLPDEVLRQVQQDVWNLSGSGVGVLEHSHRGKVIDRVFEECEADCRKVGNIPPSHRILFLTGGSSAQNHMIPMNFLPRDRTADYIVTGYWAQKTFDQASKSGGLWGAAHLAGTSKDKNHSYIPGREQLRFSDNPAYVYYCSNNTIFGTEWHRVPEAPAGVPLIADMCSDIFSRPVDFSRYGLVHASAQKNLGPAGVTLVVAREDLVERGSREIPDLLQYRTFVPELSRPNTPPVFGVHVMGLVFKWILRQGGLEAMAKRNAAKAKIVYDVLDQSKFYKGHARPDSRSLMNVVFRCPTEELDERFCAEAKKAGLDALKGHRSAGGMRASLYNAMPEAGCTALAQFMREFERKNG
jgi:phosphoserine aminotransferase